VAPDGTLFTEEGPVGRLGVYTLDQPQKVGRDLFTGQPQRAQNFKVMQGFLEGSNVNPILEMTKLIETHRVHEVYSNLIRALDQAQERAISGLV